MCIAACVRYCTCYFTRNIRLHNILGRGTNHYFAIFVYLHRNWTNHILGIQWESF